MPTPPDTAVPPELAALAEYTDLRPLGQGGMGVVYAGTQVLMNRPVVLKVMTPAAEGGEAATERFLREIRAAAALDHPNVVKAYAAHRAGRRLVFVMEYVAGDDLAKLVEARGPLPVANAAYFAYQAALGLQHAHDRGLVHRDIKPGNLLVAKAFGKTVVKVADFGLAKAARERELSHGLTGDGRLMGTPHFLAPEQALDAARADIRADIYSLGCTLYHLLAGRPPFDGGSLIALVDAHRSATARPLDRVRPEVPAGVAAEVAKMMAKDPADRHQTPGEAARALVPFFKPGGTAATPVHTHVPADPPPRAVVTAIPLDTPPAPAAAVSHWKPPTVFRGGSVPHDTAYLNAEDFNPPAKPPKSPRKKKPPTPVAVGPLVGVAVAVAAVVVGGLVALVGLRDKPVGAVAAPTAPSDQPPVLPSPADGFVSLFSGRDTSDWAVVPGTADNWTVENGSLIGRGGSKASHLFFNRYYSDFHLRAEYRINATGNSGVYFRAAQTAGETYPAGYEAQINPTDRSGPPTGSLYLNSKVAATGGHVGVPGEWTTLEVIAAGPSVTVKVNGVTTSTFTASTGHPTRGRIALQHHNPQTVVEFRKFEVKELDAPADAKPPTATAPSNPAPPP